MGPMSDQLTKPKQLRIRKRDWEEAVAIDKASKTSTGVTHVIRVAIAAGLSEARKQFVIK